MEFYKLKQGSNIVRLVTNPYQYFYHNLPIPDIDWRDRRRFFCTKKSGSCYCCDILKLEQPSPRWILVIISRLDNNFYYLDIGYSIFAEIRSLIRSGAEDPQNYDLDIKYNKPYIYIKEQAATPLTERELLLISSIDKAQLNEMMTLSDTERLEAEEYIKLYLSFS